MPLSFKLPESEALLPRVHPQDTNGAPLEHLAVYTAPQQLPPEKRFTRMGGSCAVSCRTSVVRVTTMKLIGTGLFAALMAASVDPKFAYGCSLSAAVNFVATGHYILIWMARAQVAPPVYGPYMSKVAGNKEDDPARLFAQELAVDGLRHSDWTITLVLMTLDMWHIAKNANPNGTAILNEFWCAALQPVMVFFGTIPRFYLNEFRYQEFDGKDAHNASGRMGFWASFTIGSVAFLIATAIFGVCTGSLIEFIWDSGTPPAEGLRLLDAQVMTGLMLSQIGYPVVFLFSILYLHCFQRGEQWYKRGGDYPAMLSFYKDMAYSTLDITAKAGLALYSASRPIFMS